MKPYYTVGEIISKYYFNLPDLLNHFVHNPNDDLYIYVNEDMGYCGIKKGFLKIPKALLQEMEIDALNSKRIFSLKISHYLLTIDVKIWKEFVALDVDLTKFSEENRKKIVDSNKTVTEAVVQINQIFIKTESSFIKETERAHQKFDLNKYKGPLHLAADKLLEHLVKNKPYLLKAGAQEDVENELKAICPEFKEEGNTQSCREVVKLTRKGHVSRGAKKVSFS